LLTDSETISVIISNYGLQEQESFPVQYQIDGGDIVTENFTGTIPPGESVNFSFSTTADLSEEGHVYTISASTALITDEDNTNDAVTSEVRHLYENDMGVNSIIAPLSGTGFTDSEPVIVELKNFGGVEQENVPVSYTLNGNTVEEIAPGPFPPNTVQNYTFNQTANLYNIGIYELTVATHLPDDADSANDSKSIIVEHSMCQPQSDCTEGDFISYVEFNHLKNTSACSYLGYGDYTNISTDLLVDRNYDLTVTVNYTEDYFTAWIDYNDNFIFEEDEMIVTDYIFGENQISESIALTHTFNIEIPHDANLGEHLMRLKINWWASASDPCENVEYGETEDYKVNIVDPFAGVTGEKLIVFTEGNNNFLIELYSPEDNDEKYIEVFSTQGERVVFYKLSKINDKYSYNLNMNYVAKGVYLVRIGNDKGGKIAKIIVQ